MVDEAGVEIDSLVELVQFDPLVDGMGLGDVAGADDDHLFHLLGIGHSVGTIGHGAGFALAGELECRVDQGVCARSVEGLAAVFDFEAEPVLLGAFAGLVDQSIDIDAGHRAVVKGADALHGRDISGAVVVVDTDAQFGVRWLEFIIAKALGCKYLFV